MATPEFDDFVRRQQAKKRENNELDVGRQLEEWREYLAILYRMIEDYLAAYINNGAAAIEYRAIEINEEFSGPYKVDQMNLAIGPSTIQFKPIGTMLIGSKGRVDVQGPHGTARFVLMNRMISEPRQLIRISVSVNVPPAPPPVSESDTPIDWAWKLATSPPDMRFIDLDEATFFNTILLVADA